MFEKEHYHFYYLQDNIMKEPIIYINMEFDMHACIYAMIYITDIQTYLHILLEWQGSHMSVIWNIMYLWFTLTLAYYRHLSSHLVRSSTRYTYCRDPSAASKGLSFNLFSFFITRASVHIRTNFMIIDHGGFVVCMGGEGECSMVSLTGGSLPWSFEEAYLSGGWPQCSREQGVERPWGENSQGRAPCYPQCLWYLLRLQKYIWS